MKRFIEGEARTQVTLLPECLDDYVSEENPVRVVDVFVDELDLGVLGFESSSSQAQMHAQWPRAAEAPKRLVTTYKRCRRQTPSDHCP
jgi:transposase